MNIVDGAPGTREGASDEADGSTVPGVDAPTDGLAGDEPDED